MDEAQSFLDYVSSTDLSFHILFSITCTSLTGSIMMNRKQLWCKDQYQGCQSNMKRTSMWMYLRGLDNLCSQSVAYNQGQLTLMFWYHFVWLQIKGSYHLSIVWPQSTSDHLSTCGPISRPPQSVFGLKVNFFWNDQKNCWFDHNVWKYRLMNTATAIFTTTVRQMTEM